MRDYRSDIEVLFNAIDLDGYTFRLREAFKPHLVWLRAFHEIYNPQLAPRVVALLAAEFPGVSLVMVGRDKGDGSLQATRELAAHLGVAGRISFPGGVSKTDVPDWLNRGEIFLNTTNVDNTPVSVLEAMACGLPVVSTNVGGIPYLLKTEEDALLVPANDPAAMAAAIGRVLREPALARRLSRNARATAEQRSWSLVLPRWKELIAEAAGQGEKCR
jgi:glycosyltransferase involved in cell wall biosynthesis